MTNVITIDVAGFKKVLDMVKGAVPSKPAQPILSNVKLDWDKQENKFYVSATNTDQYITVECAERRKTDDGVQVEPCVRMFSDGREGWQPVCLSYANLREAFSLLPAARRCTVTIEQSEEKGQLMTIDYQDGKMVLPYEAADEFPKPVEVVTQDSERGQRYKQILADIERIKAEQGDGAEGLTTLRTELSGIPAPQCRFEMEATVLLKAVREARTCCATDELRPTMEAVCLDCFIDKMIVVASDGHSLYRRVIDTVGYMKQVGFPVDQSATILVPKQAMPSLAAFDQADRLTVCADTQRIRFESDGIVMVTRAIEGKYPNYDSVIPKDNQLHVTLDRDTLTMAIRRIGLSANSSSNMGVMRYADNAFIIEASDYDFSREGSERVPVQQTDAFMGDFAIGFKLSTLQSLLGIVGTEGVDFFFSDPSRAFLMKPEGANASLTLLQMPMLVNE